MTQLRCIDQVSVVGQRQSTLYIVEYQRLGVLSGTAARRGIAGMSYADIAEATGWHLKSVKSYIQNGKRNLKICIEKRTER